VILVIKPEPSDAERRAILGALQAPRTAPAAYESRWRAAALDDLRDGPLAEESGSDARIVEP
jgi:hypothetical protein